MDTGVVPHHPQKSWPLQLGWAEDGEYEAQPRQRTLSDLVDKQLDIWNLEIDRSV
jgi:hypothetical protein